MIAAWVFCLCCPLRSPAVPAPGPDAFGYTVAPTTNFSFVDITNGSSRVLWFDDDAAVTNVSLGFPFNFYGTSYTNVSFNLNGLMTFGGASTNFANVNFLTTSPAENLPSIAVLWDDWETQSPGSDGVYYKTTGAAGSRQFIVQWNKVIPVNGSGTNPVTYQVRLFEGSNRILCSYSQVLVVESNSVASLGAGATVGIRDVNGQINNRNLQWSFNQAVITNGLNLLFNPGNRAPVINAAAITPATPTRTNALLVIVTDAQDPDGDPISYTYQWQRSPDNATFTNLTGQTAGMLNAATTVAGSYYRALLTPNDGQTNGAPFTTASVRVATDANANGINDDWELQYFGQIGIAVNADADGDGASNLAEYLSGTNPTNRASCLRVTSLTLTGASVVVNWASVGGKSYTAQTSAAPRGAFSDMTPALAVPGTGETVSSFVDQNARTNGPLRFYRVRLVQ